MTPEEMRAAGRLATRTLADTVSSVEQVHHAIAARAFALTGPASFPARVVHDRVATGVYAVIRGAGLVAGLAASELVGVAAGSAVPAGSTARGNLAVAVLNAVLGDQLAEQASPLAIGMAVKPPAQTSSLSATRSTSRSLRRPRNWRFSSRLGATGGVWRLHVDRHGCTYGSRLTHDLGYTPVYLRYNTGCHISQNGRHLAALLDKVVAEWPVPVAELILVGHSMGGLVARSACHYGQQTDSSWVSTVRHVCTSAPHIWEQDSNSQ